MPGRHHGHYTGGNYHQTVVIQQGPGPSPYGAVPGQTVIVHQGLRFTRIHGKGFVALGSFLLVVSSVLFICGALRMTGVFSGGGRSRREQHRDMWNFEHRNDDFNSGFGSAFFDTPIGLGLMGFGVFIFVVGLSCLIPSVRHEMKKKNQQQLQQQTTGDQSLTGPDQPMLHQPSQPHYPSSYQPSYQQGSTIPLQPLESNPSCQQGSVFPPQPFQSYPSYQQGSTIPPQPFQPITPSMNPPPYNWTAPYPPPNTGVTSFAYPEMGYKKDNLVP